jgi:prepilin peptidase CpaA
MLWVPLLVLVLATIVDLRRREIPDVLSLLLLGWAIAATALGIAPQGWVSLIFGLGGFGGGDAKLMAALGAVLGPQDYAWFMFYVAMAGGVMALVAISRGKRDLPYAQTMAVGFAVFMWLG